VLPPSEVRPRGQNELRIVARMAAVFGLFVLSTTPISMQVSAFVMNDPVFVDPIATGAVNPDAETLVVPRLADAIPQPPAISPPDNSFLFATGYANATEHAAPQIETVMTVALAARPPIAEPVDNAEVAAAAIAEDETAIIVDGPIAFAEPIGTDDIEAPFRALINPLARPETGLNGPDPITDHDWVANPIPASARTASQVRCMAEAVYFEARSEPIRGQLAVAQVVINRLKNPTYPGTVCGVVYQNQQMRNACQFSFACDGMREVINDRDAWVIAEEIARASLNGEAIWLEEVGAATHYHATYVRPSWARQMQRMALIGVHVFYRTYGGGWI
jgi:hypothetical protein